MSFKEQLQKDLSVFINQEEFAEEVTIDGENVIVVIDNDTLVEQNLKSGGEGLVTNGLLFHVKKVDMPFIPVPSQNMTFNDSFYYIVDVKDSDGMYSITLEASQS